ncbi:MAG: tetratricopeptide repeat protein, partial [Candidatus Rokuibacteriota bacterium]
MTQRSSARRLGFRIGLTVSVALLVLLSVRHLSRMDERFFRFSFPGLTGLALYLVGDYGKAARAYRADLTERLRHNPARVEPSWRALVEGDLVEAKRLAKAQVTSGGPAIHARLTLGEVALAEGNQAEALRWFDEVLQAEIDQYDALLLASVAHARLGAHGRAVEALNRALRHNRVETRPTAFLAALEIAGSLARMPTARRPWCLLAHYHRYLRIYDPSNARLAIRNAERAVEVGDRPDDAYLTIGIVHRRHQRPDLALQAFLRAIELNPRHPEALRWAAGIYADRGDLASEYRLRKAAFEAVPDDPYHADHFYYLLFTKLGDYVQALALTRRSLERNPEDRESLARLGGIYRALGDDEQALEHYRKALALAPRDPA